MTPVLRQERVEIIPFPKLIENSGNDGYDPPMDNERIAKIEARLDGVERHLSNIEHEVKGLRWWILGTFVGFVAVVVSFGAYQASWFQHSLDRNWELSRKADERATEANIKAEAMRLATEWQNQTLKK